MVATQPGFLDDAMGQPSSMRLMCVIALGAAVVFGAVTLLKGDASGNGVYLSGMFLAAAFGGKVGQKAVEAKAP